MRDKIYEQMEAAAVGQCSFTVLTRLTNVLCVLWRTRVRLAKLCRKVKMLLFHVTWCRRSTRSTHVRHKLRRAEIMLSCPDQVLNTGDIHNNRVRGGKG